MTTRAAVVTAARLGELVERKQTVVEIGERLRSARLAAGLSQTQAARLTTTPQSTISEVEGARRAPTLFMLIDLAAVYDVTVGWLVGDEA